MFCPRGLPQQASPSPRLPSAQTALRTLPSPARTVRAAGRGRCLPARTLCRLLERGTSQHTACSLPCTVASPLPSVREPLRGHQMPHGDRRPPTLLFTCPPASMRCLRSKTRFQTFLPNAHWNECHKCLSFQKVLPLASVPLGERGLCCTPGQAPGLPQALCSCLPPSSLVTRPRLGPQSPPQRQWHRVSRPEPAGPLAPSQARAPPSDRWPGLVLWAPAAPSRPSL